MIDIALIEKLINGGGVLALSVIVWFELRRIASRLDRLADILMGADDEEEGAPASKRGRRANHWWRRRPPMPVKLKGDN